MIYLDGSRFFFDIEGCFSNLVEKAREENKNSDADNEAKLLCEGFGKFFGIDKKFVAAGDSYKTVLNGIFEKTPKTVIPEFDISAERYCEVFGETELIRVKKGPDMKLKAENIAACAEENNADMIFLSNPCCPTTLEILPDEILKLCNMTKATVVVDESFSVDENVSVLKNIAKTENLIVLKKMRFAGDIVFACGKNLPNYSCNISAAEQAVGNVIFEHNSALKTAQRKLLDSRDSLYIRIKKLAIKYSSMERLYRSKANCVFFKVNGADEKAKMLLEKGISIYNKDGYFCIFSGDKSENELVLDALSDVLK